MKKLSLIFLMCFFSYISFSQKGELSNYEKYRIEKEKQENLALNSQDTVYIVDTVYVESEESKELEAIINNNYYTSNYSLRHRLYFEYYSGRLNYTPWFYDDLFMYGYSYPYYSWNYFPYNPWYFGFRYNPWSFRSYWNTPWYYSSYYVYNSGRYYADRDYYRNKYQNRRNGVIRHRNNPNTNTRNYSPYNRSNSKTKIVAQREPVKVNRTVYLDKNTRRNISGVNNKVNNRRTTPTYNTTRSKRPAYNSTRRITATQNKSSYYKRPTVINRSSSTNRSYSRSATNKSYSGSSGTRSSVSRSSSSSGSRSSGSSRSSGGSGRRR